MQITFQQLTKPLMLTEYLLLTHNISWKIKFRTFWDDVDSLSLLFYTPVQCIYIFYILEFGVYLGYDLIQYAHM